MKGGNEDDERWVGKKKLKGRNLGRWTAQLVNGVGHTAKDWLTVLGRLKAAAASPFRTLLDRGRRVIFFVIMVSSKHLTLCHVPPLLSHPRSAGDTISVSWLYQGVYGPLG
jgi:hypothetical protein